MITIASGIILAYLFIVLAIPLMFLGSWILGAVVVTGLERASDGLHKLTDGITKVLPKSEPVDPNKPKPGFWDGLDD